jgi:predicted ribosome-associated RNA-binding protein Tma20
MFPVQDNSVIFGDPDNPDKVITQETQEVTHVNLDTDYSLSEVDHEVLVFDASDARFETIGLVWHLRDPDGKIVVVQAGLQVFDTNTGDVIKVTPHVNPNSASVICPAPRREPRVRNH